MDIPINGRLCRAARGLVGLTQAELARAARIAKQTVTDFERGERTPHVNNRVAIQRALEERGVAFIVEGASGVGVKLSPVPGSDRQGLNGAMYRQKPRK